MKLKNLPFVIGLSILIMGSAFADEFTVTSEDISHGEFMSKAHEYKGFGCDGENMSPQLSWQGAPKGTKAFAVLVHDPDAPSGSGWWHWQVVNIPANVNGLLAGAGKASANKLPDGSRQIENDYGYKGFGGACPPPKDGAHRYRFAVHALSKPLDLPENASGALTGYMVKAHSLASSTIEALYKRD